MIPFKTFFKEETITQSMLERLLVIFNKKAEKDLKTKFYRYGGNNGYVQLLHGIGVLYIYDKNKAIRFNYIKQSISSITVWDSFKLGKLGDKTIDLGGLDIMTAYQTVIRILLNKEKQTTIELSPNPELSEARRVSSAEFYKIITDNMPPTINPKMLKWDMVASIASIHDINVPMAFRDTKAGGKGTDTYFDITKLLHSNSPNVDKAVPPADGVEPEYYIKVTKLDRETGKFTSVKGDEHASEMLAQIKNAINTPDVKQLQRDPDSLFGKMKNLVQLVCRDIRKALLIYGGPGTGKTFTVLQTLASEGLQKNEDFFIVKGKITTAALYQMLFIHREGAVLMFDDTDSIWGDQEASNILKAALDSYPVRTISWLSGRTINVSKFSKDQRDAYNFNIDTKLNSDEDIDISKLKLPSEFDYKGRIIFISNLPYEKFDDAVLTRSAKIDMTLTQAEMLARIRSNLAHLGDSSVPVETKEQILDFLVKSSSSGLLSDVSMRTFINAEDLYRSGLPNWQELLDYV